MKDIISNINQVEIDPIHFPNDAKIIYSENAL